MYNVSDDFIKKIYKLLKAKILPDGLKSGYVRTGAASGTTLAQNSTCEGLANEASGFYSHAEGYQTRAVEVCAHAEGSSSIARGMYAHAEGGSCNASGDGSHAEGDRCIALGRFSHAGGICCTATNDGQTVIGRYNLHTSTEDIFVIGNGGDSFSKSNCFRIIKSGTLYAKAALQTSGADYAEFFEWTDYNMKDEDRRGYFVTFDDEDKIRIANPEDDYVLGIVSSNPVIIGNSDPDGWSKRFLKDEFGNYIMEEVKNLIPVDIEKDGNVIYEEYTTEAHVINPDYNPEKEDMYVSRQDRQEWSPIGLLGQLIVRDDGTCKVNKNCVVGNGGIATLSSDSSKGWRVIKRVNDHLVKILFR